MTLLDPAARIARGEERQASLTGQPAVEPATLLESTWRDFIYAEVWTRPGLDLRSRFLISIAAAAGAGNSAALEQHLRGVLAGNFITLAELREAALHVAVYSGWGCGGLIDTALTKTAAALGLQPEDYIPLRAAPWDPQTRIADGQAGFAKVMLFPTPNSGDAFTEGGILNFVFGEMWTRPGLDERSRRWLTLVGVANSAAAIPIGSHVWAAMASGNATQLEMYEFVLQYAIHAGWPRASVVNAAVRTQGERVAQGLPFSP
jgi:4-carboxymuconolactone decarboxylase